MAETAAAAPPAPRARRAAADLRDHGVYVALGRSLLGFNLLFTPNFATAGQPAAAAGPGRPDRDRRARAWRWSSRPRASTCRSGRSWRWPPRCSRSTWATGRGPPSRWPWSSARSSAPSTAGWWPSSASSRSSPRSALLVAGRALALVLADGRLVEIFDPTLGCDRQRQRPRASRSRCWSPGALAALVAVLVRRVDVRPAARRDRRQPRPRPPWPGCPVRRTLFAVYVLSGLLAAAGRRGQHRPARRQRPVVRRAAHRAQRDHRGGRSAAPRWPAARSGWSARCRARC